MHNRSFGLAWRRSGTWYGLYKTSSPSRCRRKGGRGMSRPFMPFMGNPLAIQTKPAQLHPHHIIYERSALPFRSYSHYCRLFSFIYFDTAAAAEAMFLGGVCRRLRWYWGVAKGRAPSTCVWTTLLTWQKYLIECWGGCVLWQKCHGGMVVLTI